MPEAIRKSYKDVDIITAENDFSAYLSTKNKLTYETYLSKIRQIWLFLKEENVGTLRQITPTVLTKFLASRYAGSTRTVQESLLLHFHGSQNETLLSHGFASG